jgi:hypothetical protein
LFTHIAIAAALQASEYPLFENDDGSRSGPSWRGFA